MSAVFHQIFFMTFVGSSEQVEEINLDDYRITNFQFTADSYSPDDYVVFDFSQSQE